MSFRILNQAPQYLLPSGKVNAGGRLHFYATDLSTPKDTWSDEALTVLNTNPVLMDGAGRTVTDVWGDDSEYGVVMTDAAGVTIWTRNNVRSDAGAGTQIPALQSGQFLTNDGSVLQWQQIVLLPDLTGTNGNILYSDGALPYWGPAPSLVVPDPEIVVGTASFRAGISTDETKFLIKTGAGSCPASGSTITNGSVVFDEPYGTLWQVYLQAKGSGVTAAQHLPILSVSAQSPTGFSVMVNVNVLSGGGQSNIISPVNFSWMAVGTVEVAPEA